MYTVHVHCTLCIVADVYYVLLSQCTIHVQCCIVHHKPLSSIFIPVIYCETYNMYSSMYISRVLPKKREVQW